MITFGVRRLAAAFAPSPTPPKRTPSESPSEGAASRRLPFLPLSHPGPVRVGSAFLFRDSSPNKKSTRHPDERLLSTRPSPDRRSLIAGRAVLHNPRSLFAQSPKHVFRAPHPMFPQTKHKSQITNRDSPSLSVILEFPRLSSLPCPRRTACR
jgi:hypothetical protein